MKDIVLTINTTDSNKISVTLTVGNKKTTKVGDSKILKAQQTLVIAEELLTNSNISFNDLTKIEVNPGPGSFVGLRVGLSIANTLGFFLKIPVNGQKPPVLPKYQ